jgi:2-hydroxychromene-2-carboxylate isomerase
MRSIEFWFEYGSTYSYLTVGRLGKLAQAAGVEVNWKPFLLMPLMIKQGLTQGPFLPFPRKMAYMWRDIERRAAEHGLQYRRPSRYPPEEVLTTARVGCMASNEGWCQSFTEKSFELHWTRDIPIGSNENLHQSIRHAGHEPATEIERARRPETKEALKSQTEQAGKLGIFGSPTFLVGDEMFWGDDRVEQALAWAARG